MDKNILIQHPGVAGSDNLRSFIIAKVCNANFDSAKVAVAYATVAGIRKFLDAFENQLPKKSYWLIGIDDAITQPGAIELLLNMDNAEVRMASCESKNFRFHPKFFSFADTQSPKKILSLIGSANLTASALTKNAEAIAILEGQSAQDVQDANAAWKKLWKLGVKPSKKNLKAYKYRYNRTAKLQKKPPLRAKTTHEVLSTDYAEIDPSIAKICWIECGKITGHGRQLELKAEQGIFFGLSPHGGDEKTISITASNGSSTQLKMNYRKNRMWRLQMNNTIPEVARGLRLKVNGKLERSPYVAIFKRIGVDSFSLRFIKLKSKEFGRLKKKTDDQGALGRTTAREYGWC